MKWNESIKKAPVTVMQIGAQSEIVRWGAGVTKIEHVQHMHAATLFFFFFLFQTKNQECSVYCNWKRQVVGKDS